ncbi:MAG: hypothetical protein DCC55_22435 [Chloroflexi bacterium]|nr:MAG: hypothetical protein DCC55_22435 [Chloroflexota bacterium]
MTRPKPYRTKHRHLNDDAIARTHEIRKLLIRIHRHIPANDMVGTALAIEIDELVSSVLAALEEERRILDNGTQGAPPSETEIDRLWAAIQELQERLT